MDDIGVNRQGEQFEAQWHAPPDYSMEDLHILKQIGMANQGLMPLNVYDLLKILMVLFIGFLIGHTYRGCTDKNKQKYDELLTQLQGQGKQYERAVYRAKFWQDWMYRVWWIEKLFYVALIVTCSVFYKNDAFWKYVLVTNGIRCLLSVIIIFIMFSLTNWYLEGKHSSAKEKVIDLKKMQKDVKLQLLSQMDPIVVETLREIVRADMRAELDYMKNSDEGCSQKCILMKLILEKEYARNEVIVSAMRDFEWCDTCSQNIPEQCKQACGQRLVHKCIPLMRAYGDQEKELTKMRQKFQFMTEKTKRFSEFKKAKIEFEKQQKAVSELFMKKQNTDSFINKYRKEQQQAEELYAQEQLDSSCTQQQDEQPQEQPDELDEKRVVED